MNWLRWPDLLLERFTAWSKELDRRSRSGEFGKYPWQEQYGLWPWQRRRKKNGGLS